MKTFFTIIYLFITLSIFSQSDKIYGEYLFQGGNEKHRTEYKLNLYEDGTFTFHSFTYIALPPQKIDKYGKGTWELDDKIVSFHVNKQKDIDNNHTLDFSNSRARFITKSPRDKTNRIIKTSLQFFESKIFWIKRLKILKK